MSIEKKDVLKIDRIDTPIGTMVAVANENLLFLLEFEDKTRLTDEITHFTKKIKLNIAPGKTIITTSIKKELAQYFKGNLPCFNTPFSMIGTLFQQTVWKALSNIPSGETCSYAELAASIKHPTACRAVARANASNRLAILIPCHRVINANGQLGGYAGGLMRKSWLIEHEKK
ncbi:MAG: methylated-DNA--[protein]-cysteine S-methyltransferase [Gammaproteobacteria bacterium]|nr:methylated-DNA--[protein]-cysteine S-methyltransferase [Gammaproteobacteria bacterium]